MNGSDPPPNGSDRTAARLRAAATRLDKPVAAARSTAATAEKKAPAPKVAATGAPPRLRKAAAANATAGERTASAAVREPRTVSAAAQQPKPASPGRPGNGAAAPSAAAAKRIAVADETAIARASASASNKRRATRVLQDAGEPYPPLTDPLVNGLGTPGKDTKRAGRAAPRSPRTALEPERVEMPARRSRTARNPFVIVGNAIISLFVLAAIAAAVALVVGKQHFDAPGPLAADRIVSIPHGSGIRDIADVLSRQGVIDQPWVFIGGVLVLKAREGLKAGEYQFKAHASLSDVVATIVDGRVVQHQITIPEGLTSEQIVARLLDDDVLTGNIKEIPREGSLLPDTYNFTRGLTREQIIARMQQSQQHLVKEIWDHRAPDLPLKTADQLVILASLVEKETGKPEERSRVAAVFVNRMRQHMRLQSDPTIIYGLVGGKGTLGRPILKSEIDQPTPYNTYQIDGLPPGPIANPGRASLEAAANPARTRELYFVADGTGGHLFSETYEQHQKNVARLRQIENKDRTAADAKPDAPAAQPAPPAPRADPPPRTRHHHRR